jgi:hypothetical protein
VGYEWFLRANPGTTIPAGPLVAHLEQAHSTGRFEISSEPSRPEPAVPVVQDRGPWSLPNGQTRVEARPWLDDTGLAGVDFDIPFGGSEEEMRKAFAFVTGLASSLQCLVFDPQLGREVGINSADEVISRWRASQGWMLDVVGGTPDNRAVAELAPTTPLIGWQVKVILVAAAGFATLLWLLDLLGR